MSGTIQAISGTDELLRLKTSLHRQIIELVDFSRAEAMQEEELRNQLRALADYLCGRQAESLSATDREVLVGELMDEIYGLVRLNR